MNDIKPNVSDLPHFLPGVYRESYHASATFEFDRPLERSELEDYVHGEWRGDTLIAGLLKLPVPPLFRATAVAAVVERCLVVGTMQIGDDSDGVPKAYVRGFAPATAEQGEAEDTFGLMCDLVESGRGASARFDSRSPSGDAWQHVARPFDTVTGVALALFLCLSDTLFFRPDRVRHARGPEPRPLDDARTRPVAGPDVPRMHWRPACWSVSDSGRVRYERERLVDRDSGRPVDVDAAGGGIDNGGPNYPVYSVGI